MKLILKMDKKPYGTIGAPITVLNVPDNTHVPPMVKYKYACLDCASIHFAKFHYVGIHDDGTIYALKDLH